MMKLAVLPALLLAAVAQAVTVEPGTEVPPYTMLVIRYDEGEAVNVINSSLEKVPILNIRSEHAAAFTAPPGKYAVLAAKAESLEIIPVTIGTAPTPPNPPGPNPPTPPNPPGPVLTPTGERVRSSVVSKVSSQYRPLAKQYADLMRQGASQIAAGLDFSTVNQALRGELEKLLPLGAPRTAWAGANADLKLILQQEIALRGSTPEANSALFREVADGLEVASTQGRGT